MYGAICAHNKRIKAQEQENKNKLVKHQEKCYHSDFWSSKSVCNGTFGNTATQPTFSVNQTNDFCGPNYSQIEPFNKEAIKWFPFLPITDILPFCMDPMCAKDVRSALKTRSNSSSPCPDGINYEEVARCSPLFVNNLHSNSQGWFISHQIIDKQQYNTYSQER